MKKSLFLILLVLIHVTSLLFAQGSPESSLFLSSLKNDDYEQMVKSLYLTEQKIQSINEEYEKLWNKEKQKIESSYEPEFHEIVTLEPEIWESDRMFDERIEEKKAELQKKMDAELKLSQMEIYAKRDKRKVFYEDLRENVEQHLQEIKTIEDKYIELEFEEFQRNERLWKIFVTSNHPLAVFRDLEFSVDFNALLKNTERTEYDIREEIVDFHGAVQRDQFTSKIDWNVRKDQDRYVIGIKRIAITNEINNIEYMTEYSNDLLTTAYSVQGNEYNEIELMLVPVVTGIRFSGDVKRIGEGKSFTLHPEFVPENSRYDIINWDIEDSSVVTVQSDNILSLGSREGTTVAEILIDDGYFVQMFPLQIKSKKENYRSWDGYNSRISIESYETVLLDIHKDDVLGPEKVYLDGEYIGVTPLTYETAEDSLNLKIGRKEKLLELDSNLAKFSIIPHNLIPYSEADYPDFMPMVKPPILTEQVKTSYCFTTIGALANGIRSAYQLNEILESGVYNDLSTFNKWENIVNVGIGGPVLGISIISLTFKLIRSFDDEEMAAGLLGTPLAFPSAFFIASGYLGINLLKEFENVDGREWIHDPFLVTVNSFFGGAFWGALPGFALDLVIRKIRASSQEKRLKQEIKQTKEQNEIIKERNEQLLQEINEKTAEENKRIELINEQRGYWEIEKIPKTQFYNVIGTKHSFLSYIQKSFC